VPHIFAATDRALFYAYGYAAATDRLWQMDVYRRTARGTLAEVLGASALASDRHERTYGYTEGEYQVQFAQLPTAVQDILSAYRDGVNAYLAEIAADTSVLPWEFHRLGYTPAPWETTDTLAIGRFMANRFGASGGNELHLQALQQFLVGAYGATMGAAMFEDLHWLNDPDAPTTAATTTPGSKPGTAAGIATQRLPPHLPGVDRAAAAVAAQEEAARAVWSAYGVPVKLGSYAWAISPARSATGHALLYGGPQMGFETPDVVHEVQLSGGQGYDAIGVGFAGVPLIFIGHNRYVAWSITSGMGDNGDIFVERLKPGEPERYWHDGAWRTMITRTETIYVAGRMAPVTEVIRQGVHGPIIYLDAENDLAYALAQAQRMQEHAMLAGLYDLVRATNLAEFGQGVARFEVSNHLLYADVAGNIAYWQAGAIPIRADGRHVGRLPWLGDGSEEWTGALRALPGDVNPAQGYLANWNNKAATDFYNGDAVRLGKQDRVSDILELLAADASVSWDDMRAIVRRIATVKWYGTETRYVRAYLLAALATGAGDDARLAVAGARLAAWDGHFTGDAIAGTEMCPEEKLWTTWASQALLNTFGDELGSYWTEADLNTLLHALDGSASGVPPARNYFDQIGTVAVETADEVLVQSLREALDLLTAQYGTEDLDAWVDPRPVIAFVHPLGMPLGQMLVSNRATYAQIVGLSAPIVAENILPLGQSGAISPDGAHDVHLGDQSALYQQFGYKPMRLIALTTQHLPLILRESASLPLDWCP